MLSVGRTRMIAVALAAVVVAGALAVAALGAGSPTADRWDGTLDYSTVRGPTFTRVVRLRVRVTHRGIVVFSRPVALPRDCIPDGCRLAAAIHGRPFQLVDFGAVKSLTALIWLRTGGPHCCTVLRALSVPEGRTAAKNFGVAGARLMTLGDLREIVSADDRFAYLFTSLASSGLPVQIWSVRSARFTDATRVFPETIAADAARWWKASQRARRSRGEARGVFAAWAADTCALGEGTAVRRELAIGVAAGVFSRPRGEPGGPAGAGYAAALLRKLKAWGYCR